MLRTLRGLSLRARRASVHAFPRTALADGLALALVSTFALGAAAAFTAPLDPADDPGPRYDNTYAKDFIMDAPWRVVDANTPIPITVILKDCDADDISELHWIRAVDRTNGSVPIWYHDFGGEEIGDDVFEHNYWTWITLVTEGHPLLPNGTPLTPANLGYGPGATIELEVSVYFRDDWFNYTETRVLRVRVGDGPFPWPAGWYGGDTHYHTMYTNNIAEFGAPIPAVREAGKALGLHWLTVTDHSCDLDEMGDGEYSYGTPAWEYTIQSGAGIQTDYRNNSIYSDMWQASGADVAEFDSPSFRLYRGVEANLSSIDADSWQKTLHCLLYSPTYVHSPNSGALGERPVFPSLPVGLSQIMGTGFAFAAHPIDDLGSEFGGFDFTVNGARWGDEDITAALGYESFRGLQLFNTRTTVESSDQNDPWSEFDGGNSASNPYPIGLLTGIDLWDQRLRAGLGSTRPKILISGGSDAHGDFNYASFFGLDNYATDNAIGKVQTVVFVPGGWSAGDLPPVSELLGALENGRSVATDGPFVEIGLDRNGDGDWDDTGDVRLGDEAVVNPTASLPLGVRWATLAEFGTVASLRVWVSTPSQTVAILDVDPSATGGGLAGDTVVDLGGLGLSGPTYVRAECRTSDGNLGHRAYTNPIWLTFDPATPVEILNRDDSELAFVSAYPNPFAPSTALVFRVPSGEHSDRVDLGIYDLAGRRVRSLLARETLPGGEHRAVWDARDDGGRPSPAGVYFARLRVGGETVTRKVVLLP